MVTGDTSADELAELRRRAYGPDADIAGDPDALARLNELEAAARAAASAHRAALAPSAAPSPRSHPSHPAPPFAETGDSYRDQVRGTGARRRSPGSPEADGRDGRDGDTPAGDATDADAGDTPAGDAPLAPVRAVGEIEPTERRLTRRIRVAWAASVAVTAVVAAGLALWIFPFGARDDAQHAARLTPQPGEVPEGIGWRTDEDETLRSFGAYEGIAVYADTECVYAYFLPTETSSATTESSYTFGGCAGAGIAPIMDVYLPPAETADSYYQGVDYPAQLRERFPEGAMLRFALRSEGEIVVDVGELPALYFG